MRQRHNIPAGKSLLLRLSVCRFFLFCCLAVFACSAFGQKVKQEAVFYKNAGILAVGNMSKGKFVEGSRIKFYRFSSAISYRVKKSGDEIYLKHGRDEKRLSDLKILIDCIYYKENEEDRFKGFLDCDGPFCYGTFKLYNSPDSKSFVHNSKDPSGKFFYDILSVDSTQAKIGSWLVSAKKTEAGYLMRAKNDYDRYIAKSKLPILVEGILPLEDFDIKSAIGIPLMTLMHKLKCAKVTLKSRDEFDGTVKLKRRIEGIVKVGAAGEEELDCELLNGTYKYHLTGDVFVGEYQRIYHDPSGIHIPTRGTMKFANGDSITGDWLAGYTFDYDDWEKIFDESNGPTDIRNKAIALKQQKDEEEAKKQGIADIILNPLKDDVIAEVKKLTHGRGADVCIECAGVKATFDMSWQVVRPNGTVSILALYGDSQELPLQIMGGKNLTIRSGWVDSTHMQELIDLIESGKLNTDFLITHEAPLNDIL